MACLQEVLTNTEWRQHCASRERPLLLTLRNLCTQKPARTCGPVVCESQGTAESSQNPYNTFAEEEPTPKTNHPTLKFLITRVVGNRKTCIQGLRAFRTPYVSAGVKVGGRATHFHGSSPPTFMGLAATLFLQGFSSRETAWAGWVTAEGGWVTSGWDPLGGLLLGSFDHT